MCVSIYFPFSFFFIPTTQRDGGLLIEKFLRAVSEGLSGAARRSQRCECGTPVNQYFSNLLFSIDDDDKLQASYKELCSSRKNNPLWCKKSDVDYDEASELCLIKRRKKKKKKKKKKRGGKKKSKKKEKEKENQLQQSKREKRKNVAI